MLANLAVPRIVGGVKVWVLICGVASICRDMWLVSQKTKCARPTRVGEGTSGTLQHCHNCFTMGRWPQRRRRLLALFSFPRHTPTRLPSASLGQCPEPTSTPIIHCAIILSVHILVVGHGNIANFPMKMIYGIFDAPQKVV